MIVAHDHVGRGCQMHLPAHRGRLRHPLISGMDPAGFCVRALGGGWLGLDMTGRDK